MTEHFQFRRVLAEMMDERGEVRVANGLLALKAEKALNAMGTKYTKSTDLVNDKVFITFKEVMEDVD